MIPLAPDDNIFIPDDNIKSQMITIAADDNIFILDDNISSQMITLAPDDNIQSQMITFHSR